MESDRDFYKVLGIERDALPDEIRSAYFAFAKKVHPDTNPNPIAKEDFFVIKQAYETLNNPAKRAAYDLKLKPLFVADSIILDIKYSQKTLRALDEPQLVYGMLDLVNPASTDPSQLIPIHICLVIDNSTSMKGERMEMIKASATRLIKKLNENDIVTIVAFNDRAEVVLPATKPAIFQGIEQKINHLNPSGGTEIYQGLEMGVRQLQIFNNKIDTFVRHLVLFTDGHTYGDESRCLELVKQAKESGINISILGIGGDWNDVFLDQLAGIAGGNTIFVSSPHDIDLHLDQKIKLLSSLYARNITFELTDNPNAEMRYAFRITPDTNPLPISSSINLGNLYCGGNLSILFEFLVPPIKTTSGKIILAKGKITGDLIRSKTPIRYPLSLSRRYSTTSDQQSPPAILVEAMARLTLYRLQEKARREVMEGQVVKAVGHLQSLATHLLSIGQPDLASAIMIEAEYVRRSHSFSKDGDKRIKYGTKALLLPSGLESI